MDSSSAVVNKQTTYLAGRDLHSRRGNTGDAVPENSRLECKAFRELHCSEMRQIPPA